MFNLNTQETPKVEDVLAGIGIYKAYPFLTFRRTVLHCIACHEDIFPDDTVSEFVTMHSECEV